MQTGISSEPAPRSKLTRKEWFALPLLFAASALLAALVYLLFFWPGSLISKPAALDWQGASLNLTKGQGYKSNGILNIESLEEQGQQGLAVASISPRSFRARDYTATQWLISGVQPGVQAMFLWRTVENPGRVNSRPLKLDKDGFAGLELEGDKDWDGQIKGLALIVKGQLDGPIAVKEFSLKPATAGGALAQVIEKWFVAEVWQGSSINFLNEDALDQRAPLVLAIAVLVCFSLVLYLVLAKRGILRSDIVVIWCIVFLGWFALDARWQWNLLRQLDLTRQQYAGKALTDKHQVADDSLFQFMHQVNSKLGPGSERVLVFSDDPYARGKGTYYLFPHNVMAAVNESAVAQLKSGDYVVLFAKKGVKYDTSSSTLSWEGLQPVKMEMLLSSAGNYLFRIH